MLVLLLTACSVFQPIDGTWFFQMDRNVSATGDCGGSDSGGDGEYIGTDNMWAEGYTLTGNQVGFVFGGEVLLGTLEGTALEVSSEDGYTQGNRTSRQTEKLEATLSGGTLEGSYSSSYEESVGDNGYHCITTQDFTAQRSSSTENQYPTH